MHSVKAVIVSFSVLFALTGCVRPEGIRTTDIDPLGWERGDTAKIEIQNNDTLTPRTLSLLLRFDNTLEKREIPLRIKVTTPDSLWYAEGFTAKITDEVRVNNDFYESVIPYRTDAVLSRPGRYLFEITNAGGELRGVWGIGIVADAKD